MRFDVLTLFPALFDGFVSHSLLKKAIDRSLLSVNLHDIRQWSNDKHNKVDDRPYGGGPGMVLRVAPVVECAEAVQAMTQPAGRLILLSPQGQAPSRYASRASAAFQEEPWSHDLPCSNGST